MRRKASQGIRLIAASLLLVLACGKPEPLTQKKAEEIIGASSSKREPIYAEVPQRVWWSPTSPKDDYDEKALRTLRNLERAGLITVTESVKGDEASYLGKITQKGFPILGTTPSMRGATFRGKICEKTYDGLKNFTRHPHEPTVGHAELVWHYDRPTWLYPLFETKINKPLNHAFASDISFFYEKHQWKFTVMVTKRDAE
jgi:hypothetical protein